MEKSRTGSRFVVDPFAITNYDRTQAELEALFVFCVCVAGKKASMISRMVAEFLGDCAYRGSPFARIRGMLRDGTLDENLRRAHLGKYKLLHRCFVEATAPGALDLKTATVEQLEAIHGWGNKTSRFFILHSRRGARVAVIDTHMLKYLRAIGTPRVPAVIPSGKDYLRLEKVILAEAERLGLNEADFDLQVWTWYTGKSRSNDGLPMFRSAAASVLGEATFGTIAEQASLQTPAGC